MCYLIFGSNKYRKVHIIIIFLTKGFLCCCSNSLDLMQGVDNLSISKVTFSLG